MIHLQNHYPVLSCKFGLKTLVTSCHILVGPEWPRDLKCLCVPSQCYLVLQRGWSHGLWQLSRVPAGVGSAGVPQDWCCAQLLASTERLCHLCCTQSRSWQAISSFFLSWVLPGPHQVLGQNRQSLCIWFPVWLCAWTAMIHWTHYPGMKMSR